MRCTRRLALSTHWRRPALAAAKGQQVPANIDTGVNIITKANMNSTRSQELLNPKTKSDR
jgi:ribose transport system substrate-binding protein